jgi:dinuclear metal center YbgI/SA1388 family protein
MTVQLKEITSYLDELLDIAAIPADVSNNGLQVEASEKVRKAVFGVDACLELFEAAKAKDADFIFVHHGLSWGGEPRRFTGITASRLNLLFNEKISLYAAHLPLDAHPSIGHNILLAEMVGLKHCYSFADYNGCKIGCGGELPENCSLSGLASKFEKSLDSKVKIFGNADKKIRKVGIISGGGGMSGLMDCISEGMDCYITGEMEHTMYHILKESGISVIQLGHYRSEIPGVLAVMDKIRKKFDLECEFVDIPTGL